MLKNQIYSSAFKYLTECKYSVIPVGKDKKPLVKWQEYQKRLPTEQEILEWWTKYPEANVGIITGIISNLAVIDLDEVDKAKEALEPLIPDSILFPIVKTPSGGLHWYFACPEGNLSNNARTINGADLRANGGYVVAPPSINGSNKGWKWQNDALTPFKIPLPYLPHAYLAALKVLGVNAVNAFSKDFSPLIGGGVIGGGERSISFDSGTRDEALFHTANCLIKGKMSQENILKVLEILAKNCNPPYLEDVKIKFLSAEKRQERALQDVKKELEALLELTTGAFSLTDTYIALKSLTDLQGIAGLGTRRDPLRNAIQQQLHRWKKEGIVKSWGEKAGWYVKVENQADVIEWENADISPLEIKYPFQLEDYALTFPKNIITLAGEQNSGKTAYCLNFAKLNIENKYKMPIIYCSSEMGAAELRMRLLKFENVQLPVWRRIKFIERASNFADIIDPDGINIIDYMEITDNFYKVAEYTKEIFDKLKKGICLIAIQKDKKSEFGRGGAFGLEKPRIYLNMGNGQLRVVKAKVWVSPEVNPNGMIIDFKIINGSKLSETYVNGAIGWRDEKK